MAHNQPTELSCVVFDVDGVFTTGQFVYTSDGKFAKIFGPHDSDGIKLLQTRVSVEAISADKRGWDITKKRMDDMGLEVTLVSEQERKNFFRQYGDVGAVAYMGDGMYDADIFPVVGYGIAPANAHPLALQAAHFVTHAKGGEGAVGEACLHILEQFFQSEPAPAHAREVKQ